MNEISLNYDEISEIMRSNLKIENNVKSISTIFENERYMNKVDYKPYFQRNYVWNNEKASYFIESIFLGTEIPPIVLFDKGNTIEIIDGRQRFETIYKFVSNKIELSELGLKTLFSLASKKFDDLSNEFKEIFMDTKIRILSFCIVNEPKLTEEKEDIIKKEIFRRYNSGITPLKKEEIQRAYYIKDPLTLLLKKEIENDNNYYTNLKLLFLSKREKEKIKRDAINILLSKIRTMITLHYTPINRYAHENNKGEYISLYYGYYIEKEDINIIVETFRRGVDKLLKVQNELSKYSMELADNELVYECSEWVISILYNKYNIEQLNSDIIFNYALYLAENEIIFEKTGSHYHKQIKDRYTTVANFFKEQFNLSDFDKHLKNSSQNNLKPPVEADESTSSDLEKYRINKPDSTSLSIEDICRDISKKRFLIRPSYQRSEVMNISKASALVESIILGIRIPPIFLFKRDDRVFEVIDGQQRLLSIIGFLGRSYLDENGRMVNSVRDKFKLKDLKIMKELNGKRYEDIEQTYIDRILDFSLDVVEIDATKNDNFDNIDLFLRLNSKPYAIKDNSFEMWNSYIDKQIVTKIKDLQREYDVWFLRKNTNRMVNEELLTTLAYMDFKKRIFNHEPFSYVGVYIKSGKVNARIKNKGDITRILSECSKDKAKKSEFLYSIDRIVSFIKKVEILLDTEDLKSQLIELFDCKSHRVTSKTNQNYYILWILMENYDLSNIRMRKIELHKKFSDIFLYMQNCPEESTDKDFIYLINE